MTQHTYRVLFRKLPEGGYQVTAPAFPEIIAYGPTLYEAREMAEDAILRHLDGILKNGEEVPEEAPSTAPPCSAKNGSPIFWEQLRESVKVYMWFESLPGSFGRFLRRISLHTNTGF